MKRRAGTIVAVAVVLFLAGLIWVNRGRFVPLDAGSRAPDHTVFDLTGEKVALADLFGDDVVILNIWATWCAPCIHEMPALQRLYDELRDDGLNVVAVSVDAAPGSLGPLGQPGGDVAAFVQRLGLTFPILHDPSGGIERLYQVNGLPTTYVIDRDGHIVRRVLGAVEWDRPEFADPIRALLEG